MVMALLDQRLFTWDEFQTALIARIAQWQMWSEQREQWRYYQHWLGALEDMLASCGSLFVADVATRVESLTRRPAGHDHGP
jgi:nitrile hydratase accessory protein